ncbi:MAG: LPS assembly lipoprotein LptE [Phycisphaerales bacterium]
MSERVRRVIGTTAVLAAGMVLCVPGCSSDPRQGYSFTSTFSSDVESIAVPVFQNTTYGRGLELELTEAVVAELRSRTPWRISTEDQAHTTIRGTITSAELRKLSTARDTGLVEELAVEVTVDFEWKDNRTGRVIVSRRGFTGAEAFAPARGIGERIETGQHATVQELARAIVAEMRSGW